MIQWYYFPKSHRPIDIAARVVEAFTSVVSEIDSRAHKYNSNQVLQKVSGPLRALGFTVEAGAPRAGSGRASDPAARVVGFLPADARDELFELQITARQLERAMNPAGSSTTTLAVMTRIYGV